METKTSVKGTVKDSVFTDLFSESKYLLQLYDKEEIMRMHDFGVAVRAAVETYKDCNMDFVDVVNRISDRFEVARERAEEMAAEYWNE